MNDRIGIIKINNISKTFGKHTVLSDVSLECHPGKIYGFVGYNGSGKTVLFKCICGILRVDSGCVNVNGTDIRDQMVHNAGIIIEEPAFLGNDTGKRNLEILYLLNHKKDSKAICDAMQAVGLDPHSRKKAKDYSLGMRQRLAIAQAIMENPDILILDEPMNGLDQDGVKEIREMLIKLKEAGKTILLASHNREDIAILCDEVYEMSHGTIAVWNEGSK